MKNKVFKKLAAMVAALMMAVTGTAVNASADTVTSISWNVNKSYSYSSTLVDTDTYYYNGITRKYYNDYIQFFTYSLNNNGTRARVNFYGYIQNQAGLLETQTAFSTYEYTADNNKDNYSSIERAHNINTLTMNTYLTAGKKLVVKHSLENAYTNVTAFGRGEIQ